MSVKEDLLNRFPRITVALQLLREGKERSGSPPHQPCRHKLGYSKLLLLL